MGIDVPERASELLESVGLAQAANEPLDVEDLARGAGASVAAIRLELEQLEQMGLLLSGLDEGLFPILLDAGKQYLKRNGEVSSEVLRFLSRSIDDLYAREALIHAGTVLVDEFRYQWLHGDAVDHAAQLVPQGFAQSVDRAKALELFAAAVALMARLSSGEPAGCVAEEIMAVNLIEDARARLDMRLAEGELTEGEVTSAARAMDGLFELFEDDDVLDMFAMREPADAALAQHDPSKRALDVVDQRVESWFEPLGLTIPTGYLGN
jgi:hypothetical protein